MVILNTKLLNDAKQVYPDVSMWIDNFISRMQVETAATPLVLRQSWATAVGLGNHQYKFDVRGNSYRLIVLILFDKQIAQVLWFGTHAEYDRLNLPFENLP